MYVCLSLGVLVCLHAFVLAPWQALGDKPVRSYAVGDHVQGVPQVPKGIRDAQRNHWYGSESRRVACNCQRHLLMCVCVCRTFHGGLQR